MAKVEEMRHGCLYTVSLGAASGMHDVQRSASSAVFALGKHPWQSLHLHIATPDLRREFTPLSPAGEL